MTTKAQTATTLMLENGGNVSKAMRDAGYSESTAKNPQKFKARPEVQNELQRLLKRKGITLDKALQPIADGLTATKMVTHGKDEDSWVDMIPDHTTRLASSDRALKLLNITKDNPQPPNLAELKAAIEDNTDEVSLVAMTFRKDDVQSRS